MAMFCLLVNLMAMFCLLVNLIARFCLLVHLIAKFCQLVSLIAMFCILVNLMANDFCSDDTVCSWYHFYQRVTLKVHCHVYFKNFSY